AAGHEPLAEALVRARALAQPAHGRAAACERDPLPARAAQAGPQGRPHLHPHPHPLAAEVPRDGEGPRPPHGGPQVRAREGQQGPRHVPDLAEQDHRRPVGAPARRARRRPAPV
ncbi:MAG: hypothetical protein AVDCRST_MAG13-2277, partial [uncultured Solirubrobacteraceae bacterium]